MSQRDAIVSPGIAPTWALEPGSNGHKFLSVMGYALDALLKKQEQANLARMPGRGDPTTIPLLAADRVLEQGINETNLAFIERLKSAYEVWGRAGGRPAVLEQLQAMFTGMQPGVAIDLPECLIVGGNQQVTTWDSLFLGDPQGAAPRHKLVVPRNFNWDNQPKNKRAWLVLFMHSIATGQVGTSATIASVGGSGVSGVTSGFATITGLTGMLAGNVGDFLHASGASTGANNGAFQITSVLSATSVIIANTAAVASESYTAWHVEHYPFIKPAPVWGAPAFVWGAAGLTWGAIVPPFFLDSIRRILRRWKSASTYYPNIIISFGGGTSAGVPAVPASPPGGITFTCNQAETGFGPANGTRYGYGVYAYKIIGGVKYCSPGFSDYDISDPNNGSHFANDITITGGGSQDGFFIQREINFVPVATIDIGNALAYTDHGAPNDPAAAARWGVVYSGSPPILVGDELSPQSSQGNGNPDGTWFDYGRNVNGVWVPARRTPNPFTSVCDGTGEAVQCYEKNRT